MWSLIVALLLPGCSTTTPDDAPAARVPAKGKVKGKGKGKVKSPVAAPLGVAGPVVGELMLTVTDAPVGAPAPAPATPAPEAAPAPAPGEAPAPAPAPVPAPETAPAPAPAPDAEPAPAPAGPTVKRTRAEMKLSFADGSDTTVLLGTVPGVCSESEPTPIGPPTGQKMPLWSVHCVDGARTSDLAILQVTEVLTVMKLVPGGTGAVLPKPVKRIRLAPGATLQKKGS